MKAKTLLIAAAALAAGIISSQAQTYSQNIVGYANVVSPTGGNLYLMAVPFNVGVSNGANEVFPNIDPYTQILAWDNVNQTYNIYNADPRKSSGWSDVNFTEVGAPVLPVGQGFFVVTVNDNTTNTFAGTVALSLGTSNVMTLPTGGNLYCVGSPVPYAGSVTNGSPSGGGLNLNGLGSYTQLLLWDSNIQDYNVFNVDPRSATGWSDVSFTATTPPTINIAQGFFIIPTYDSTTWTNGISAH